MPTREKEKAIKPKGGGPGNATPYVKLKIAGAKMVIGPRNPRTLKLFRALQQTSIERYLAPPLSGEQISHGMP